MHFKNVGIYFLHSRIPYIWTAILHEQLLCVRELVTLDQYACSDSKDA